SRLPTFKTGLMNNTLGVLIGTVVQVACLVAIIAVSLLKPWGRRGLKEQKPSKSSTISQTLTNS
ncbi:MAG TPA: hypothetical protein DCP31_33670, partial [Cyanobacteria bacterium UBA8543]|nr:hypothetical protein [Cyanobacteria bacterium UBA8543]